VFPSNHAKRTIEILQLPFFLDSLVFWLILASMVFEIAKINLCCNMNFVLKNYIIYLVKTGKTKLCRNK